jgi:flavin-dependent dehydrogenase
LRPPPVIIGGGPAGAAAAIHLGLAGHRPVVIERSTGPTDKVCGDFLGADAIERLRALGVDPMRLGAAPIDRVRLIHRNRATETALPFPAVGLSRRVLDDALLHRAAAAGAVIRVGEAVRRIARHDMAWRIDIGDPPPAAEVFLATGKHDLRGQPRSGALNGAVGMKMYYHLTRRQTDDQAGSVELILFPGGYAGLQCVENGTAVLCIALRRQSVPAGGWPSLLAAIQADCPHLRDRLAGAKPLLPRPLAVAGVPYGLLHRDDFEAPAGLFRLGDQAAVIPSLAGAGIAIALYSGTLAAETWAGGSGSTVYHRRLAADLGGQMRLARLLHKAMLTGPLQAALVRGAAWSPWAVRHAARGTRLRGGVPFDPCFASLGNLS